MTVEPLATAGHLMDLHMQIAIEAMISDRGICDNADGALVVRSFQTWKAAALAQLQHTLLARSDACGPVLNFNLLLGDGESAAVH
jgi:hypothetical protein